MTTTAPTAPTTAHPAWCDRTACSVDPTRPGYGHHSRPVMVGHVTLELVAADVPAPAHVVWLQVRPVGGGQLRDVTSLFRGEARRLHAALGELLALVDEDGRA